MWLKFFESLSREDCKSSEDTERQGSRALRRLRWVPVAMLETEISPAHKVE